MRRFFTWLQRKRWLERHPALAVAVLFAAASLPGLSGWLLEGPWQVAAVSMTALLLPTFCFYCWFRDANPLPRPVLDLPKRDGEVYLSAAKAEQVFALLEREVLHKTEVEDERRTFFAVYPYGISTLPLFAHCRHHVYPAHLYAAGDRLWFEIYRREADSVALCQKVNDDLAALFAAASPPPGPRSRLSLFAARSA